MSWRKDPCPYRSYWRKAPDGWVFFWSPGDEWPEGQIADFALWNGALTRAEIKLLVKGMRPNQVAPNKLMKWYPYGGFK